MNNARAHADPVASNAAATRALPVVLAILFGILLLWGVGFSHIGAFHNAAHDTRHSNAFPCH